MNPLTSIKGTITLGFVLALVAALVLPSIGRFNIPELTLFCYMSSLVLLGLVFCITLILFKCLQWERLWLTKVVLDQLRLVNILHQKPCFGFVCQQLQHGLLVPGLLKCCMVLLHAFMFKTTYGASQI